MNVYPASFATPSSHTGDNSQRPLAMLMQQLKRNYLLLRHLRACHVLRAVPSTCNSSSNSPCRIRNLPVKKIRGIRNVLFQPSTLLHTYYNTFLSYLKALMIGNRWNTLLHIFFHSTVGISFHLFSFHIFTFIVFLFTFS